MCGFSYQTISQCDYRRPPKLSLRQHQIVAVVSSKAFSLVLACRQWSISLFAPNWFSRVPVRANAFRPQLDFDSVAKSIDSCTCTSYTECNANTHHDFFDTNNCRQQSEDDRAGYKWNPNLEKWEQRENIYFFTYDSMVANLIAKFISSNTTTYVYILIQLNFIYFSFDSCSLPYVSSVSQDLFDDFLYRPSNVGAQHLCSVFFFLIRPFWMVNRALHLSVAHRQYSRPSVNSFSLRNFWPTYISIGCPFWLLMKENVGANNDCSER